MPKLKLEATHTHAGVAYPAGHIIDVDEHTAQWLIDRGIGAPVRSEPAPVPRPSGDPASRSTRTHDKE